MPENKKINYLLLNTWQDIASQLYMTFNCTLKCRCFRLWVAYFLAEMV